MLNSPTMTPDEYRTVVRIVRDHPEYPEKQACIDEIERNLQDHYLDGRITMQLRLELMALLHGPRTKIAH